MVFFTLKILRWLVRLVLLPFRLLARLVRAILGRTGGDDDLSDWPNHDGDQTVVGSTTEETSHDGGASADADGGNTGSSTSPTGGDESSMTTATTAAGATTAALALTDRERRLSQVFVLGLVGYALVAIAGLFLLDARTFPALGAALLYGGAAVGVTRGSNAARWLGVALFVLAGTVIHLPFGLLSTLYDVGGPTLLDVVFLPAPAGLTFVEPAESVVALLLVGVGVLGRGGVAPDRSLVPVGGGSPNPEAATASASGTSTGGASGSATSSENTGSASHNGTTGGATSDGVSAGATTGGASITTAAGGASSTDSTGATGSGTRSSASTSQPSAGAAATAGSESRGSGAGPSDGSGEADTTATSTDSAPEVGSATTTAGGSRRVDSETTTLAADGESVVLGGAAVACHETDGERRWTFEPREAATAVAVDGDIVYAGTAAGHVHALDAAGGTERWPLAYRAGSPVTDLALGEHCYIGTADGRLRAIDRERGTSEWREPVGGSSVAVATTPAGPVAAGEDLVAFDGDGARRWSDEGARPVAVATDRGQTFVADGQGVAARDGEGTVRWETALDESVTALATAEGTVVVGHDAGVAELSADDGGGRGRNSTVAVAVAAPPTVVASGDVVHFPTP